MEEMETRRVSRANRLMVVARQAARFEWRRSTRAAAWCSSTIGRRHHHQLIIRGPGVTTATDSVWPVLTDSD